MKFTAFRFIFFFGYLVFLLLPLSCAPNNHPFLIELPKPPYRAEPTILVKTGFSKELVIPLNSNYVVKSISGDTISKGVSISESRINFFNPTYAINGRDMGEISEDGVRVTSSKGVQIGKKFTQYPVRLVNINGTSVVVYEVPFEQYVAGVTGSEMPTLWPIEALKAQAVASRSYAMAQIARLPKDAPYHVTATTSHQMYEKVAVGSAGPKAAKATRVQVLIFKDKVLMSFYHSTSGGRSANVESLFDCAPLSPLSSRKGTVNENSPHSTWSYKLTRSAFIKNISLKTGFTFSSTLKEILVTRHDDGTIDNVNLLFPDASMDIKGKDLRSYLGTRNVKSLWFNISISRDMVNISGRGYGHRVGMSQYGAKQMAVEGEVYEIILLEYYPGTRIVRLYK